MSNGRPKKKLEGRVQRSSGSDTWLRKLQNPVRWPLFIGMHIYLLPCERDIYIYI